MQAITIYHNPRCSKSRRTLEILQDKGLQPLIIEYLKTPLNLAQLHTLRAHFTMSEFVRIEEPAFKAHGLSLDNEELIVQTMLIEPILMQRPIVTYKDKAVIGRPPEKVLQLLQV